MCCPSYRPADTKLWDYSAELLCHVAAQCQLTEQREERLSLLRLSQVVTEEGLTPADGEPADILQRDAVAVGRGDSLKCDILYRRLRQSDSLDKLLGALDCYVLEVDIPEVRCQSRVIVTIVSLGKFAHICR